ncbi:MAG: hypothetical protein ACRDY3_04620 [Acidimicrobiales bacterium]
MTMFGSDAVLVGSLVFAAVVAAAVLSAVFLAWRSARRRWRALRRHAVVRSAVALWAMTRAGVARPGRHGARPPASVSTARARHDLWRSVGAAERSVHSAQAAGGAVGELPVLCRRLHEAAVDLDRLLLMGDGLDPGLPELVAARRQAGDVLAASTAIRRAALASAGDAAGTRVLALTVDAEREVRSLAAGLARARTALSLPDA